MRACSPPVACSSSTSGFYLAADAPRRLLDHRCADRAFARRCACACSRSSSCRADPALRDEASPPTYAAVLHRLVLRHDFAGEQPVLRRGAREGGTNSLSALGWLVSRRRLGDSRAGGSPASPSGRAEGRPSRRIARARGTHDPAKPRLARQRHACSGIARRLAALAAHERPRRGGVVNRGSARQAVPLIEEAIRQSPDKSLFHVHLGVAYYSEKQTERAVAEYTRALQSTSSSGGRGRSASTAAALPGCFGTRPRSRRSCPRRSRPSLLCPTRAAASSASPSHRSNLMAPGLAARHPDITTYSGVGIDDRTATIHADLSHLGFHASVRSSSGSWYIDPYFHLDQSVYASYYGRDVAESSTPFIERDANSAELSADKGYYHADDTVTVSGSGFAADNDVTLTISDPEEKFASRTVSAHADGAAPSPRPSRRIPTATSRRMPSRRRAGTTPRGRATRSSAPTTRRRTRRPATSSAPTASR